MNLTLTQQMLGLLRRNLQAIESKAQLITPPECRDFWRTELFDFGIAQAVIDLAATYRFEWADIIPDLYLGKFRDQGGIGHTPLPPMLCEQFLHHLIAYVLIKNKNSRLASELGQSISEEAGGQVGVDTGVANALRELPDKDKLIADLQSRSGDDLIAVVFIDLDGFKPVNDSLGHDEGDNCLMRVVEIIGGAISGKGRLYRPGGDEFVVTLPNFSRHEALLPLNEFAQQLKTATPVDHCRSRRASASQILSILIGSTQSVYSGERTLRCTERNKRRIVFSSMTARNCRPGFRQGRRNRISPPHFENPRNRDASGQAVRRI
jgi:diguanylate cyclase (GGDEF)-like protein